MNRLPPRGPVDGAGSGRQEVGLFSPLTLPHDALQVMLADLEGRGREGREEVGEEGRGWEEGRGEEEMGEGGRRGAGEGRRGRGGRGGEEDASGSQVPPAPRPLHSNPCLVSHDYVNHFKGKQSVLIRCRF